MPDTYTNPVYDKTFADPFVLRVEKMYYAYGTTGDVPEADRAVMCLHSDDLVNWTPLGGALKALPKTSKSNYWAPEVAEHDGRFYMYYSAENATDGHRLRVAIGDKPEGPFQTKPGFLTPPDVPFSIDAHPFRDDDGTWYLFYARDFIDDQRCGTAVAVDTLTDMTTLSGKWKTVCRANADWQIYERDREMYGRKLDWHTLEGAFVRKRHGKYWCLYSGGNWQNDSYGVSYVYADHPLGPWHHPLVDGKPSENALVLRTDPGRVRGPGHNSVVTTPEGIDYIVYHAWDAHRKGRKMCVDRIDYTPEGPKQVKMTTTPQPVPE